MKNKHWSHGIAEDSSDHTDPRLSTLLKCWFTFLGKILVLPKAKARCSSGDSLLQEFLLTARVLVPIKPHSTGTHVGIQLTPSVSSYKTINLKHCLHNSGILPWKIIIKNMYLCISAHTRLRVPVCTWHLCYRQNFPKRLWGDRSTYTVQALFGSTLHCLYCPRRQIFPWRT